MEKVCETCGKIFETNKKWQKYCSQECKYKANYKSVKVVRKSNCVFCGKEFETDNKKKLFCSRKCSKRKRSCANPSIMRRGNRFTTSDGYAQRVDLFTSKYEFICASDKFFTIMCKDCGCILNRSKDLFKPSHRHCIPCPECAEIVSDIDMSFKIAKRIIDIEEKTIEDKQIKFWSQSFEQQRFLFCGCCGELFYPSREHQLYCSARCATRIRNARREHIRRIRKSIQLVDKDISLEKVYKRDNGICYLCNKKTDFNDCETINGSFVVGGTYPTIEHVIPLSKGGKHSWDNVRCACHSCNSKKGVKLLNA